MDRSKEFDELFQEMKRIDRSDESRRTSLLKLKSKAEKKRFNVVPVFISIIVVAMACLLVFVLVDPAPEKNLAVDIPLEDKNKAAIRTVLEKEFTGPNEEYLVIVEDLRRQQIDPTYEGYVGQEQPTDDTAWRAFAKETYGDYFTENGLENFLMATPAFMYQWDDLDYQLSIDDIKVTQSENSNAPKNYSFTAKVTYKFKNGETKLYELKGEAICSEEGKIGKIFYSTGNLLTQMNEDANSSIDVTEKVSIFEMKDYVIKNGREFIKPEVINVFENAIKTAEKIPGISDAISPHYKVELNDETFFLWLGDGQGSIMNVKDTHTVYELTPESAKAIEVTLN